MLVHNIKIVVLNVSYTIFFNFNVFVLLFQPLYMFTYCFNFICVTGGQVKLSAQSHHYIMTYDSYNMRPNDQLCGYLCCYFAVGVNNYLNPQERNF